MPQPRAARPPAARAPAHAALALLVGCGAGIKGDPGDVDQPWCAVRDLVASSCVGCHQAGGEGAALDLSADPHAALVGPPSASIPGLPLVAPGDSGGSVLYLRLIGGGPGPMPPDAPVTPAQLAAVREWIDAGAASACDLPPGGADGGDGGDSAPPGDRHHPDGYADPGVHGLAAKMGEEACVDCHGADLTGQGAALSCDTCHTAGWRTDCTFCHGGTDEGSGAPPRDLDGSTTGLSFEAHTAHVEGGLHAPFSCEMCHTLPTDALSPGHGLVGDSTPGVAEVRFDLGLSPAASWDGSSCSDLYCHGYNGLSNGDAAHTDPPKACGSCHPVPSSDPTDWSARLSGNHDTHLLEGLACAECHPTVNSSAEIEDPTLHVNGTADVRMPSGMTLEAGSCTGSCHGETHGGRRWDY